MEPSRIVVFGDSIIWGQGLLFEQKMTTLVNRRLTDGRAELTMLAHSGALIGAELNPPAPVPFPSEVFREVPQPFPTVLQQVNTFNAAPEKVDLVLINGGSNDVGFSFILNPLSDPDDLKAQTRLCCHTHMTKLLRATLARCPNAKIIVIGHYPIVSEDSDLNLLHRFLQLQFTSLSVELIAEFEGIAITPQSIKDKVVMHSMLFWQESTVAIKAAVADIASPRLQAAFAPFTPKNSSSASEPWLWGIDRFLQPEDPMAGARREPCNLTTRDPFHRFACHRASAGHPNVEGAKQFANTIVDAYGKF